MIEKPVSGADLESLLNDVVNYPVMMVWLHASTPFTLWLFSRLFYEEESSHHNGGARFHARTSYTPLRWKRFIRKADECQELQKENLSDADWDDFYFPGCLHPNGDGSGVLTEDEIFFAKNALMDEEVRNEQLEAERELAEHLAKKRRQESRDWVDQFFKDARINLEKKSDQTPTQRPYRVVIE